MNADQPEMPKVAELISALRQAQAKAEQLWKEYQDANKPMRDAWWVAQEETNRLKTETASLIGITLDDLK